MTEETTQPITLDHNGQIPVSFRRNKAGHVVMAIGLGGLERPDNLGGDEGHFQQGLRLIADGKLLNITPYFKQDRNELRFEELPSATNLKVTLYGQPIVTLKKTGDAAYSPEIAQAHERLTVDELRMLSTSDIRQDHVPADRALWKGFEASKHAPITDLHTHSSAQLSNVDLIELALKHGLDYPVELLVGNALNIQLTEAELRKIKKEGGVGVRFSPTEHERPQLLCETEGKKCDVIPLSALTKDHLDLLRAQLQVPQDMTMSFSDFDRLYYRFVNPLVKNPALTKDMIMKIARDYQKNGVKYAELSTASMLNLDDKHQASWFKEMIEAVREAEQQTGVQLRFLIGIPRSYGPAKVMAELEKVKYAARHPLIAGVDLLGYEDNRTKDFSAVLSHIADWARSPEDEKLDPNKGWDFKRDFTIRIHAGETGKNSGNVAEAVKIAEDYGVHVRVAHAVNETDDSALDRKIKELSSRTPPLVSIELCPSSNIAYNNIQDTQKVPFARWITSCKQWFLGTDGAGAIQTNQTQLALTALANGVSLNQLAAMRAGEEKFIAHAKQCFDAKAKAYQQLYGENGQDPDVAFLRGFAEHVAEVKTWIDPKTLDPWHPKLPPRFHNKRPILVAGASGSSMKEISAPVVKDIYAQMRMLVESLDPKKAYFVVGRSKSEGVTAALDEAILEHNAKYPKNKFEVLALNTEDTPDLPRSISWVVPQPGTSNNVPQNIIRFMQGTLQNISGVSIFIGGNNFTSDMILKCRQGQGLAYLLMENAHGASAEYAKRLSPHHRFNNGKSLLSRFNSLFGEPRGTIKNAAPPFRERVDISDENYIEKLESESNRWAAGVIRRQAQQKQRA